MRISLNWTLEERERYAYITGSPIAPLLAVAASGVTIHTKELSDQVEELEKERDELAGENQKLQDLLEAAADAPSMNDVRSLCAGIQ